MHQQETKNLLQTKDPLRHEKKNDITASISLLKRFMTFLPQNMVREILKNPDRKILEKSEWIEGAVLFSDISGFTPMSQALSQYGTRGTEEMSRILNTYLARMSQIIYKNQGILQKIAGDALTVFFEKSEGTQWKVPIYNAINCSFEMQAEINRFRRIKTVAGEFSLLMKIGISNGRMFSGTLGSHEFGIEPFLIGRPVNLAVNSEHNAEQGEVWIHKESYNKVSDYVRVIEEKEDYLRINKIKNYQVKNKQEKPSFSVKLSNENKAKILNEIRTIVPHLIAKRLELGYDEFLGELRKTTTLFISFDGLTFENEHFEEYLKQYYHSMQKIITQYQGTLYEFESGDKGNKIIAIFGSPTSTEDDEGSAVLCAEAMQNACKDIEWLSSQKIGISTGNVFTGVIGTPLLKRYAVIGDKVNLSARLMSVSEPNSILADEETYQRTKDKIRWEKMPPRKIKGKTGLINTYKFIETKELEEDDAIKKILYLIGREEETKRIVKVFNRLEDNEGQILSVIGEMGLGKKSLVEAFIEYAERKDTSAYQAMCYNYGVHIPYFGWTQIFKDIIGLKEQDSNQTKLEKTTAFINELLPDSINKIPLLGQVIGIKIEDNEWSRNLDPPVKKSNLFDLMSDILIELSKDRKLTLILYDIQWSNISSLEFASTLAKNIKNEQIMLILSYRPFTDQLPKSLADIKKQDNFNHIVLSELTSDQCLDFINLKWRVKGIPENVKETIIRGVSGNPFYIETLMSSLIETKQLLHDEESDEYYFPKDSYTNNIDVPPTIQGLIMSHMDKLDETSKLILKVASVIGMNFDIKLLKWVFPIKLSLEGFKEKLDYLKTTGLIEKEIRNNVISYSFRNEITQETAYYNLPFTQRKTLHETIASTMESLYKDKIDSYYGIVAYHYCFTDKTSKQFKYLKKAGEKAQNNFANKESVEYYTKLTSILEESLRQNNEPLLKEWEQVATELFDTYIKLSDINRFMGDMKSSKSWLEKGTTLIIKIGDEHRRYTLLRSFGEWCEFGDQYQQALEYYSRAYKCVKKINLMEQISLSSGHLGNLYRTIGQYQQAEKHYKEAADLAHQIGDIMMEGRWLGNIGIINSNQGDYDTALTYYFKALDISREENDKSREAAWLSLIASLYVAQAKYDGALKYGYASLDVASSIGYKRSMVLTLNTLGNTYRFLGKYDKALEVHHQALDIAKNIGAVNQEVICRGEIGEIYRFQEKWDEAFEFYKNAFGIAKSLGDKYNQALWERAMGIVYYQSPQPKVKKAKQHLRNSMETARSIGHKKLSAEAEIHLGNAIAVDGELEDAEKVIRSGLNLAQKIHHPGLTIWGKRMLGVILIKLGQKEEGQKELLYALKENEALGLTKDIAECSLELGRELKDKHYLERALKLFKELQLNSRVKQVQEYLSMLG